MLLNMNIPSINVFNITEVSRRPLPSRSIYNRVE